MRSALGTAELLPREWGGAWSSQRRRGPEALHGGGPGVSLMDGEGRDHLQKRALMLGSDLRSQGALCKQALVGSGGPGPRPADSGAAHCLGHARCHEAPEPWDSGDPWELGSSHRDTGQSAPLTHFSVMPAP